MLIVMSTYSNNEYDKEDYDCAVFKMEKQEAQIIAQHFNLFKLNHDSMSELCEMVFHAEDETLCEFYSEQIWYTDQLDTMPKEVRENFDYQQGWAVLPEDYEREFTPKDAHAPHGVFLVICERGFFWRAYPQEPSLTIETQVLPREVLSRVL